MRVKYSEIYDVKLTYDKMFRRTRLVRIATLVQVS